MTRQYTTLDLTRHYELLDPLSFDQPIHIIGVGATGSWVALALAKLGLTDITVWDDDVVEAHNVPNQAFGVPDVGKSKAESMAALIGLETGTTIKFRKERVTNQPLAGYVFLMVDSMSARKEIWMNSCRFKPAVKHVIEPRMGLHVGRVYNVNPMDMKQIAGYEATYSYGDDTPDVDVSACGASMTVITSAMHIASICVRQLINHVNGIELDNEILLDFMYNGVYPTKWK